MVEQLKSQSSIDQDSRVNNLAALLSRINPPLPANVSRHIISDFEKVTDFALIHKRLPPNAFRDYRVEEDKFSGGITHVSHRDWGHLGEYDRIALIGFNPEAEKPITAVAIVPSSTPILREQRRSIDRLKSTHLKRVSAALEKGETPKFR